jgi:hypothetical protein
MLGHHTVKSSKKQGAPELNTSDLRTVTGAG